MDDTNKKYSLIGESILENKIHKPLWDFEKQADHLISARKTDLPRIKKKEEIFPYR